MRTPFSPWRVPATIALLALGGCFKLSRDTPPVQYFVLSGSAAPSAVSSTVTATATGTASTADTTALALGLRRINLASYLAVPSIMMRRGVNELVVSDFHRWGEDLGEGINRVVAAHLATGAPVRTVDVAPWAAGTRHDFLVQLNVSRFEGAADSAATEGRSHVMAGWDIIRPLDGRVLVRGTTEAREGPWRVTDYSGLVRGLDAALQQVARDIRSCLARFPNDSTPPARCDAATDAQR